MVSTAAQGGLIPWQTGMITSVGRFQFILGREVGIYLYGSLQGADAFLVPDDRLGEDLWALVTVRSTKLDFPFFEYRPIRTFSRKQSASLVVQPHTAVDLPGKVTMVSHPEAEPMKLRPVWMLGIKLGFDWRYYYSKEKK
jgi:hypothetical protein